MLLKALRIVGLFGIATAFMSTSVYSESDPHRFDPLITSNWYGLYMQGAKLGYMKMSLEKTQKPVDGWRQEATLNLEMHMGDQLVAMNITDVKYYKAPEAELISSQFVMHSPTGEIKVDGEIKGDSFVIDSNIGGQVTRKAFPRPFDSLDNTLAVELGILSGTLKVGDSLEFASFDPSPPLTGLIEQKAHAESRESYIFNGIPTEVYVINIVLPKLNVVTRSMVDLYGVTLEGSFGGIMTIKLEGEEQAKLLNDTFDIINDNLVIPDMAIGNPREVSKLSLKISGIDPADALQTGMQKVTEDSIGVRLDITRQIAPQKPVPFGEFSDDARKFLASDPLEQSDDPRIIQLAREIVGDEKDSWEAARKINIWVFSNIEKRFTPDFSNALQTLNSRQGDCGEHAALAVALMRAAGIPARPVAGLAYWPPGNGFGYHAWIEIYAGKWLQMDPAWGEDLADPTHIALVSGDIIAQVGVLHRVMGRIAISVLDKM